MLGAEFRRNQLQLRGRRQQWQSSLLGLQRRDEALKVLYSRDLVLLLYQHPAGRCFIQ